MSAEVPAELRARIAEAEQAARGLLLRARALDHASRDIDRALVALNEERGGDDVSLDRLIEAVDALTRLENEIADTVTGLIATPWRAG